MKFHNRTYQYERYNAQSVGGKVISQDIFGVIILATLDQLRQSDTFDDVADILGLQSLRYPER